MSAGHVTPIELDPQQRLQLLLTLGQALLAMMFLINMQLAWWEAAALLALFVVPFAGAIAAKVATAIYFLWAGFELLRMVQGRREPVALIQFTEVWQKHVKRA